MDFRASVELVGLVIEGTGVAIITVGALVSTVWFLLRILRQGAKAAYHEYRQVLGRSILLGLEFLVAGDIIRTVAVEPTLRSVTVLGLIVLIRTFLSITLELELEGRWPWQRDQRKAGGG